MQNARSLHSSFSHAYFVICHKARAKSVTMCGLQVHNESDLPKDLLHSTL